MVNLESYDVTAWLTYNRNTHIAQYLENKGSQTMKFGQLTENNMKNHTQNVVEKLFSDHFLEN